MISGARIQKLFAYLLPLLGGKTSKAELNKIYEDIEKILGYDAKRAAKYRQDAKDRDVVMAAMMKVCLAPSGRDKAAAAPRGREPVRMCMPKPAAPPRPTDA
eukprot:jgi/Tetstr1/454138/TSEL_041057.t1